MPTDQFDVTVFDCRVNEVVVPLLSMQSSVLLCISTLLDGSNHYSKMINLTDETGAKVFESLQISLVCDACLKSENPEKCTHKVRFYVMEQPTPSTFRLKPISSPCVFVLSFCADVRDPQVSFPS